MDSPKFYLKLNCSIVKIELLKLYLLIINRTYKALQIYIWKIQKSV